MAMIQNLILRMGLLVVINMFVMFLLTTIMSLFGLHPTQFIQYIVFYAFIGFGGALFSLLFSKRAAKRSFNLQMVDENSSGAEEKWLLKSVHELASKAGFKKMPEVGIFQNDTLNAFATGPSKSNSLVAVSTGLMNHMNKDEVYGVLAHEVAHIKNGDMVTMTLVQGIMNTMVMILARILSDVISSALNKNSNRGGYFIRMILFQVIAALLGFFAMFVVAGFSRFREFRADRGGAELGGRQNMIAALKKLATHYQPEVAKQDKALASMKVSGFFGKGLKKLHCTHPPLTDRIRRLETGA